MRRIPRAAWGLGRREELLRTIQERMPDVPVYLLSLDSTTSPESHVGPAMDGELLAARVRAGGVRGVIASGLIDSLQPDFRQQRDQFLQGLLAVAERTWRERTAARLGQERKVLHFETAPLIDAEHQQFLIRLRRLHGTLA